MQNQKGKLVFMKQIDIRFADPITALDLSSKNVCLGSAMGRLTFYDIQNKKDIVLSDSQPEIIRGISHSGDGTKIYVSIGDISCAQMDVDTFNTTELWQIVEHPDDNAHRPHCERAFTLNHMHYNCVINLELEGKDDTRDFKFVKPPPINMSDLEQNTLQCYGEGEVKFDQNTVPFDFDGQRLLWLKYEDKDVRHIMIYHFNKNNPVTTVKTFNKNDGMISHVKFLKKQGGGGDFIFFVKDTQFIEILNLNSLEQDTIGKTPDSVIAFNVSSNQLRQKDIEFKATLNNLNQDQDLELQNSDNNSFTVICLDESQNLTLFKQNQSQNLQKMQFQLHGAQGMDQEQKKKDWFGMGYPYFISYYDDYIACSSDYGVLLFRLL